ncbi:hypothetical protein GPS50_16180 [Acinetobacter haemolyticus]|uniref:hypothetical protein n=2 Tax=Acinetobacter haemolyticus TaxID=29430 RepID=UPI0013724424|nr:hypothetical protein [Acinetobacter haemolyticus]NAR81193.1 hypothetical protein [Acinetobacter haemolyticus]
MQQCPYCHSSHVQLLRRSQHTQSQSKISFSSCSPMSLAAVGMQISKRLGINPLVGGFIGLAAGGMFLLYIQQQDNLNRTGFVGESIF